MLYKGSCQKKFFVETLKDILTKDETFSQVSSNTTIDNGRSDSNSDGYVFESDLVKIGKKIIIGFKDYNSQQNSKSEMSIRLANDYTPSDQPNTNGEWGAGTGWRSLFFTAQEGITNYTEIQYWVDIEPHRVIIVSQKNHFGNEKPSVLYLGYPELDSQIEVHLMDNMMMIGNSIHLTSGSGYLDVLRDLDGNYVQAQKLYALLPPQNPNVAGQYQISPIHIGNSVTGFIGNLDGLWVMPEENIMNNDELEINGNRFKVFKTSLTHNHSSFNSLSSALAIKVV